MSTPSDATPLIDSIQPADSFHAIYARICSRHATMTQSRYMIFARRDAAMTSTAISPAQRQQSILIPLVVHASHHGTAMPRNIRYIRTVACIRITTIISLPAPPRRTYRQHVDVYTAHAVSERPPETERAAERRASHSTRFILHVITPHGIRHGEWLPSYTSAPRSRSGATLPSGSRYQNTEEGCLRRL